MWCRLLGAVHRIIKKLVCRESFDGAGIVYVDDLGWISTRSRASRILLEILLIYAALGLELAYEKLRASTTPHSLGYQ